MDSTLVWVDQETLETTSTFFFEGGLNRASTEVRPSSIIEVLVPEKEKRVCSKYDMCAIPLHECLFSFIGFCPPFDNFEVGVLNQLLITPSQLHQMSWTYVKVSQYWYEYIQSVPTLTLFFRLFKAQLSLIAFVKGQVLAVL